VTSTCRRDDVQFIRLDVAICRPSPSRPYCIQRILQHEHQSHSYTARRRGRPFRGAEDEESEEVEDDDNDGQSEEFQPNHTASNAFVTVMLDDDDDDDDDISSKSSETSRKTTSRSQGGPRNHLPCELRIRPRRVRQLLPTLRRLMMVWKPSF
jgi:hypothetical protein